MGQGTYPDIPDELPADGITDGILANQVLVIEWSQSVYTYKGGDLETGFLLESYMAGQFIVRFHLHPSVLQICKDFEFGYR